ncbi:MAG: hypothetical protein AAFQ45_06560 [Pseudomonadota bacterium]
MAISLQIADRRPSFGLVEFAQSLAETANRAIGKLSDWTKPRPAPLQRFIELPARASGVDGQWAALRAVRDDLSTALEATAARQAVAARHLALADYSLGELRRRLSGEDVSDYATPRGPTFRSNAFAFVPATAR